MGTSARNKLKTKAAIVLKPVNRFGLQTKSLTSIWGKVFKNGPSKICGRHPSKNLKLYRFKYFKGYLSQILLGPFLNSLPHMMAN